MTVYKYEIRGADDVVRAKADPMARRTEVPPEHGSVVDESRTSGATTSGWPSSAAEPTRTTGR
jgi:1,4-alpha-glucan branching enzyme